MNPSIRYAPTIALSALLLIGAVRAAPAAPADESLSLYTQTNSAGGNALLQFALQDDGALAPVRAVPTGGNGTGSGLAAQGAIALARANSLLFAVNAGSNSISAFRLDEGGAALIGTSPSQGTLPVSIAVHGRLLYVLNQGSDSIAGFRIQADGSLQPLPESTRPLSGSGVVGVQIAFSASGEFLVVTEKLGGTIDVFPVLDGIAQPGRFNPSAGAVPFGFALDRLDRLIVSEAAASTVSSYALDPDSGSLSVISRSVPTNQGAACWVAETPNARLAFSANAASGSISSFAIDRLGRLADLGYVPIASAAHTTDMAVDEDGRLLFALDDGVRTINGFRVERDGTLLALPVMSPDADLAFASGLVAR